MDRKMNVKLRTKVYKTAGRPVMMYDVESLAIRGKVEGLLERKETRLLRWTQGCSLENCGRKEDIRGK